MEAMLERWWYGDVEICLWEGKNGRRWYTVGDSPEDYRTMFEAVKEGKRQNGMGKEMDN